MKKFFDMVSFLFLGPSREPLQQDKIGYVHQLNCIREAWRARTGGLYRILELTLEVAHLAFPILLINQLLRKRRDNCVHFSSDIWVAFRTTLLVCLLGSGSRHSYAITLVSCYLIADILVYVARVAFLSGRHGPELSNERTLLFLLVNYGEIILGFAVLHSLWGGLNVDPLCPLQALYFSAVTATTLGYGDLYPVASCAQLRVVAQLGVNFVFITGLVGTILGRQSLSRK